MKLKLVQVVRAAWGTMVSIALIVLFFGFAIHQKDEVIKLRAVIAQAHMSYILVGVVATGAYIYCHAQIYQACLQAIGKSLPTAYSIELFLKRYFVSAFIPTGFSVSQFAFSKELDEHGIAPLESHLASILYLLTSGLAYLVVLLPTIIVLVMTNTLTRSELVGSLIVMAVTLLLAREFLILFKGKGSVFRLMKKFMPDLPEFIESWKRKKIRRPALFRAFGYAVLVEAVGALLLWISFLALGIAAGPFVALIGYVITILVLFFSPLFQGVGLVEVSLVFGLTRFGLSAPEAVAATLLFRLFQLWLPFLIGMGVYLKKRTKKIIQGLPEITGLS